MSAAPNFFAPGFLEDPYPHYQRMRSAQPVLRQAGMRGTEWLLTRHADIRGVLCDRHHFLADALPATIGRMAAADAGGDAAYLAQNIRHWLFFIDPPLHTGLRGTVVRAFSAQALQRLVPRTRALLSQCLPACGEVETDIVQTLGSWLPAAVMLDLLGVREADIDEIARRGSALFGVFEQPASAARYAALGREAEALEAVIEGWLQAPQRHLAADGLLAGLLAAGGAAGERDWLRGFVSMLLSVGQDTTRHLLGNGLAALAQAPAAWEQLATADAAGVAAAVEEIARFDSPVQLVARVAAADTEVGGQAVRRGERLYLFLGAGLRDPQVFDHPDVLDFRRPRPGTLHFGGGAHFCLGAPVARIIAGAVLQHLAVPGRRPPRLLPGVRRLHCVHLRGFSHLPLCLDLGP